MTRGLPLHLGSMTLQPVSDGALRFNPTMIFHDAPPETWQPRVERDANGNIELALTCLLVRVGERTLLVDTGYGQVPGRPEVGRLAQNLAGLGVATSDIDTVIVSHAHGDHIGGATTGAGAAARPTFPMARYWLGQADYDHFTTAGAEGLSAVALDKLLPLHAAERLDLADGEQEIAPGIRLLPLPGHTPGHTGVVFTDGQQIAIYVGDLIHHPLQIEHPDWSPIFDALPPLSRETRRALIERARREHALVLSYHLPWPGIGYVGTTWEPALPATQTQPLC
jgi:glyoxylase-like metal-dependent hydrolase (beta-lactamase superfamily II)